MYKCVPQCEKELNVGKGGTVEYDTSGESSLKRKVTVNCSKNCY